MVSNASDWRKKYLELVIKQGGPEKTDYSKFNTFLHKQDCDELISLLKPALTTETMQGFAYHKPHGYSGDFEIIDRIYTKWKTSNNKLLKWDEFFHSQEATQAVRNRKKFFLKLIYNIEKSNNDVVSVLNIGSGSGRDMLEYFQANPNSNVYFDSIDMDKNAINFAKNLCVAYSSKINFINKNIFRYKPSVQYNLIWSAGLFDYFSDKQFIFLLKRLYSYVKVNGELVVGNFSKLNPTKKYMEVIGQWFLNHRSEEDLLELVKAAGIKPSTIKIDTEPCGVNLFLCIKKDGGFK